MEKREYKGTNWTGSRKKYLVRWVDIPGVCARCSKSLQIRRLIADVAVNVPFAVFFLLLIAMDSKAFLWPLLIYALVVFKWSWGLGYLWADMLIYGSWLDSSLARFEPPGDAGTTRFPVGIGHCLLRVVLLPGLCVLMAVVVGVFVPRPDGAARPQAGAASAASQLSISDQRARDILLSAENLAVPVHAETRIMVPESLERNRYRFAAYREPSRVPLGWSYQLMTGPQLLTAFLKAGGQSQDILMVDGAGGFSIYRPDAAAIAKTIPAAEPPASAPLQR
jgi:hypothetical protein